jgi:hypothetical protein
MSQAVERWLEADADRAMSRQRAQADAAKLVATFLVGVVATLVAAMLQLGSPDAYSRWSSGLLAASILLTVVVFGLDRISEADHHGILEQAQVLHWDEQMLLSKLRLNLIAAAKDNQKVLHEVWVGLLIQFISVISCGTVAVLGMLHRP